MDMVQAFIVYAEWIFFIAWGTILAAISAIAFGRDLVAVSEPGNGEKERPWAER
jgi:hypothetical protein